MFTYDCLYGVQTYSDGELDPSPYDLNATAFFCITNNDGQYKTMDTFLFVLWLLLMLCLMMRNRRVLWLMALESCKDRLGLGLTYVSLCLYVCVCARLCCVICDM